MDFQESVNRVLNSDRIVTDGFYDALIGRYPEYGRFFTETNLAQQAAMLQMALIAVRHAPNLKIPAQEYLRVLGTRHRRREVPKELYSGFVEVLVDKLGEFHGPDWSESLADQWREALDRAVEYMFEGYEKDFHV